MAVRLKSLYYSSENIAYGIEIHDTTLGADTDVDFDMPISGAPSLQYEGDEDDIFSPILACSASFTMWVETAAHRLFFQDFVTAAEGRFYIRLYYIDGVTEIDYFIGKVVHDTAYLSDSDMPTFTIRAVDAMMELKTIDYEQANHQESFIQILLLNCLMSSTVTTLFYDNDVDDVFHVYNEYISVLQLDATDVLSDTYLENYFSKDEKGQTVKATCLDVMSELLTAFGARMYFDKGRYVFEQIRGRDTATTQYTTYNRLGTKLGIGNEDFDILVSNATDSFPLKDPLFSFAAPIRAVILSQDGDYINNLLFSNRFGYGLDLGGYTPIVIGSVPEIDDDLKLYSRVTLKPYIEKDANWVPGDPLYGYVNFITRIQIGTKYLKGTVIINKTASNQVFSAEFSDGEWTDVDTDRINIIVPSFVKYNDVQQNANDFTYTIDIISPSIESIGDITYNITNDGIFSDTDVDTVINLALPYINFWESASSSLAILKGLSESNETKGTTIISLTNDLDNTVIYNTAFNMKDFPDTTSRHRVYINSNKVDSDGWTHPDFGSMPFQQLAIHDILAIRRVVRRKLQISINLKGLLPLSPRNRLTFGSKKYMPFNINNSTAADITSGQFFEIALNKGVIINPPIIIDPYIVDHTGGFQDNTVGGGPVNLLGNTPVPADGYYKLVSSATGDNVDVSDYEGLPDPDLVTGDSIRKSLKVYIGGTKQRFNDVAKSLLIVGEFRINFASQLLEWGRDNTGKVIEIDSNENYLPIVPVA